METLLLIVAASLALFTLGFAQGKGEEIVKVALKQSVNIWGSSYHPNSKGVNMPRSHAEALGAQIINDDPPAKTKPAAEANNTPEGGEDSGEGETKQTDPAPGELPEDFPARDLLIESGIDTIAKVLQGEDLTKIKGIGNKTAEDIIAAASALTKPAAEAG